MSRMKIDLVDEYYKFCDEPMDDAMKCLLTALQELVDFVYEKGYENGKKGKKTA